MHNAMKCGLVVCMDRPFNEGRPFLGSRHREIGLTETQLRSAIAHHTVRRVFHGVYVDSEVADTRHFRILALQLVVPRHAVLCGNSASWIYGVDTFPPGRQFDFKPECVVPCDAGRSRSPHISCRQALIAPEEIAETGEVRHTVPVRTVSDLLRTLRRPYALSAADSMAHVGLVSKEEVRAFVAALKGYRGIVQARELAELIEPKSESPGEGWQRLRLADAGLPRPESQLIVADRFGREVARLDNAYVEAKVGMEYDGMEFHSLDEDRQDNADRRTVLTDILGWRMINSGKADILGRDPAFELQVGSWLGIVPSLPRNW